MHSDLHTLKTYTCADGRIRLRIPKRWTGRPEELQESNGIRWGCFDDDSDSGTLWIDFDLIRIEENRGFEGSFDDEALADVVCSASDDPRDGDFLRIPIRGGIRTHQYEDFEEDGELCRTLNTRFYLRQGTTIAIINFHIVLTHAQMDEPEYVKLRDIMEREINAAFLDPFRDENLSWATERWGGVGGIKLDSGVILILPTVSYAFSNKELGHPDNVCVCRYGPEEDPLSVIVNHNCFEPTEQLRGLLAEDDRRAFEVVRDYAGFQDDVDQKTYEETANGWLLTGERVRDGGNGASGRKRDRYWRMLHADHGELRLLSVSALRPDDPDSDDECDALIDFVDGAVRRAEFFNFEAD